MNAMRSSYRRLSLLIMCSPVLYLGYSRFYPHHETPLFPEPTINESENSLKLSTKSPYVHRPPEPSDPTSRGLELIQMHYVARHGARYPTRGNMESIRNLFETIGPHVPQDWIKPDLVDPKNTGRLASGGEKEISAIAGRMAIRYAEFLKNLFTDNQRIRFVSSEWQRSMESARVFRDTVDPDGRTLPVTVVPVTNDTTLAIRFACPLWNLLRGIHAVDIARETA
ncbi:hypothetical protein LPJ73_006135, partial [Coemansia sp. RSA 2703]